MNNSLLATWDGEGFVTAKRHAKACAANLVIGQQYVVTAELPRNMGAHRAYFANLKDMWASLPEDIAEQYPSVEHLRKFALISTGHCFETMKVFQTHRDAVLAASFAAALDEFAVVEVRDNVLRCWRAKSQSVNDMGAEAFKRSKRDVQSFVEGMIGLRARALPAPSERSAA